MLGILPLRVGHARLYHAHKVVQEMLLQVPGIEGIFLLYGARGGAAAAKGLVISQGKEVRLALVQRLGQDVLDFLQAPYGL